MASLKVDYSLVPKDSLVLVTGVTGFIGSQIADQVLLAGFRVRGTARDTKKASWIQELFDKKYGEGRFETAVIADMVPDGAYDEAVKGAILFVFLLDNAKAQRNNID
jgi:uncharacterized protein YbjT (DUF2867 family)